MSFLGLHIFNRRSMTFRLSIGILSCFVIGALCILYFLSSYMKPIVRANVEEMAKKSLQRVTSVVTSIGTETETAAMTMKNTLKDLKTSDVNMMRKILRSALQTLEYDASDASHAWIYVFPDGEVKSGTLYFGALSEDDFTFSTLPVDDFYKNYPWFKETPKAEKSFWSEPYIDEIHPEKPWVATCLIPFKFAGSDEFNGLVAVSVDLDIIQRKLHAYEDKIGGNLSVVSKSGLYIVHPDGDIQLQKNVFDIASEKDMPQVINMMYELRDQHYGDTHLHNSSVFHKKAILFYAPVSVMNWGMILEFSQHKFWEPVRRFQEKILMTLALWLLGLFFLISYICHRSTKPLLDLSKIALQYGQGDFSAALPQISSQDEIGAMNTAFHKMRDSLLEHIKLVEQNAADKQRDLSELEIARKIQESALPTDFPKNGDLEVSAGMYPAKIVGGDFYDAFYIDKHNFAVVIADVAGKEIPAALYMMTVKALIKSATQSGMSIEKVFKHVNRELCGDNVDTFVTAFMAVLNLQTGVLEYVNAGHIPPFFMNGKSYEPLKLIPNLVLGGAEGFVYQSQKLQMHSGDRLFLYTDGVTRAANAKGEFYGITRLHKVLKQELGTADSALRMIYDDVAAFSKGAERSDDMTMLEMVYHPLYEQNSNVKLLEADIKNTAYVLDWIEEDMQSHGVAEKKIRNMIVAVEEVYTNISQYAYINSGKVKITLQQDENMYRVRFTDKGVEFNPLKAREPDLDKPAEERDIGGLGIYLAKKMTDEIAYYRQDGENILILSVKMK